MLGRSQERVGKTRSGGRQRTCGCEQGLGSWQRVEELCLSFNQLSSLDGLGALTALQRLDLAFNSLSSLEGLPVGPPSGRLPVGGRLVGLASCRFGFL